MTLFQEPVGKNWMSVFSSRQPFNGWTLADRFAQRGSGRAQRQLFSDNSDTVRVLSTYLATADNATTRARGISVNRALGNRVLSGTIRASLAQPICILFIYNPAVSRSDIRALIVAPSP